MKIRKKNKKLLLEAALGKIEVDLAIKNIELLNTITGEIYPATVFVHDGFIVHVEASQLEEGLAKVKEIVDGKGKYLIPGLIDAHVHIESSMMIPRNFAKASLVHGTTTVVTDPHEVANVFGVEGVKYMLDASENLPQRQLINIPSCVPSVVDLEYAGAEFKPEHILEMSKFDRVLGLAEVMDFVGVIEGEDRMLDIIDVAEKAGLYIQGHAPGVLGRQLSAYAIGGPRTDHESVSSHEAIEKIRSGLYVDARENSLAKNVTNVIKGLEGIKYYDHLCLCTDDRECEEIQVEGHINDVIRVAIKAGLDPIDAIRAATYNTAREIKAEDLGAIAPGFIADMLVVDKLDNIEPHMVFYEGKLVAKDNKMVVDIPEVNFEIENRNTVSTKDLSLADFIIDVGDRKDYAMVNVMNYPDSRVSYSELTVEKIPIVNGQLDISFDSNLNFIAIVNRHHNQEEIGIGLIRNFGSKKGCIASTVTHDSHNISLVYKDANDALVAIAELKRVGGGQTAVLDGKVLATLELKVGGLMSVKEPKELAKEASKLKTVFRDFGIIELANPLLRIVTMGLIVIPNYKISELGIIDVLNKKTVATFAE